MRRLASARTLLVRVPLALALFPLALLVSGCCCGNKYQTVVEVLDEAQPPAPLQPPVPPVEQHTRLLMRHVYLRQADTFFLDVRRLLGEMVPTGKDGVVVFGDAKSYEVRVQEAEVAMSAESLTGLLNNHVFAYEGAPLKKLRVSTTRDGKLRQEGVLHWAHLRKKGFDVPFTIIANVEPTRDGLLRIRPVKVEICDVNGKPLMDLLQPRARAVPRPLGRARPTRRRQRPHPRPRPGAAAAAHHRAAAEGAHRGRPARAGDRAAAGRRAHRRAAAAARSRRPTNFMHLYGGTVRFGRLFMVATNLQIADAHPQDPFEFYLQYYPNQLAGGYSRSYLDDSLTTYMPDFWMVGKTLAPGERIAVGEP